MPDPPSSDPQSPPTADCAADCQETQGPSQVLDISQRVGANAPQARGQGLGMLGHGTQMAHGRQALLYLKPQTSE